MGLWTCREKNMGRGEGWQWRVGVEGMVGLGQEAWEAVVKPSLTDIRISAQSSGKSRKSLVQPSLVIFRQSMIRYYRVHLGSRTSLRKLP